MLEVQRNSEQKPAPEQRGPEGVDPDRGSRDRDRHKDGAERDRRSNEELERSKLALEHDRAACAERHGGPNRHHSGAERSREEDLRIALGAEHVISDRRVEDRPDRDADHLGRRAGQLDEVDPQAAEQQTDHAEPTRST